MKMRKQLFYGAALLTAALCLAIPLKAVPSADVSKQPSSEAGTFIKSYNALADGRWIDAWQGFRSAGKLNREKLAEICRRAAHSPSPTLLETLAVADAQARLGQSAEALALLDKLISTRPDSTLPYDLKAMVLLQSNRLDEAEAALEAAPESESGVPHNRLLRVYVALRQNHYADARKLIDRDWPKLDSCFLSYNVRGFLAVIEGRHGDGLKDFERALEMNPEFTAARDNMSFTSLMRAKGVFSVAGTNLTVEAAKGLFGASASLDFKMDYDQRNGLGMSMHAFGDLQSAKWLRSGLFARSDATLEDAGEGGKVSMASVLSGAEDMASEPTAPQPAKESELTCPLMIWN